MRVSEAGNVSRQPSVCSNRSCGVSRVIVWRASQSLLCICTAPCCKPAMPAVYLQCSLLRACSACSEPAVHAGSRLTRWLLQQTLGITWPDPSSRSVVHISHVWQNIHIFYSMVCAGKKHDEHFANIHRSLNVILISPQTYDYYYPYDYFFQKFQCPILASFDHWDASWPVDLMIMSIIMVLNVYM